MAFVMCRPLASGPSDVSGWRMALITQIQVRQPAAGDLVGDRFVVAGLGSGFEGTIGVRVCNARGAVIGTGAAQSSAGGVGVGEFSTTVSLDRSPKAGSRLTVQVFGDNPGLPGEGPDPGFDLKEVEVVHFPGLRGYLLYRVERGDTLTAIVRKTRDFGRTTVAKIVAANPRIEDPDVIQTGWRLRIPLQD